MRLTLANKIFISVGGVVCLAVVSSMVAMFSTWQIADLMVATVEENVSSIKAAEELEIALMEQRGLVSAFLLENGNRRWLRKLEERKPNFRVWLDRARAAAHTPEEAEIVSELNDRYREYDAKRNEVVALYDRGDTAAAERLLVGDVNGLYEENYKLCERIILLNEQYIESVARQARNQVEWVSWAVGGCVLVTVGFGAFLLWLFFYGVVLPVRAMVADAREFAGDVSREDRQLPTDELRAVGIYLQNLMSDVADARTTLDRSRRQLREAETLASVGKLAASVAHEIRNPLTSLKMWLFSIQKDTGGDAALARKFGVVSDEIRRLESIVRNFLEFSRPPEVKLRVESVPALLDKTLELVEPRMAERRVDVLREESSDLPPVLADAEQFRQVLLNLLNNALEAAGDGCRIAVRAASETEPNGRNMVVVRVADSGPGMPEDVARRIFEPFFTTKEEGTGLGLCIAARIMARHDGRLVLESSSDRGTTFAIHIPAAKTEQP